MTGNDIIIRLVRPVLEGLKRLVTHVSSFEDPALRVFLLSLLDQHMERIVDMKAVFMNDRFPAFTGATITGRIDAYIDAITGTPLNISDGKHVLEDLAKRSDTGSLFFALLSESVDDPMLKASLYSISHEEAKHSRVIRDRLALEELAH